MEQHNSVLFVLRSYFRRGYIKTFPQHSSPAESLLLVAPVETKGWGAGVGRNTSSRIGVRESASTTVRSSSPARPSSLARSSFGRVLEQRDFFTGTNPSKPKRLMYVPPLVPLHHSRPGRARSDRSTAFRGLLDGEHLALCRCVYHLPSEREGFGTGKSRGHGRKRHIAGRPRRRGFATR